MTQPATRNLLESLAEQAYASDYPPTKKAASVRSVWWASSVAVAAAVTLLITSALTSTRLLLPQQRQQQADLAARVVALREQVQKQTTHLRSQRAALAVSAREALQSTTAGRQILSQLRGAEVVAGATVVTGPGLCVVLDRTPASTSTRVVTDTDLARIANGLWQMGARGISINNIRLTSRSAIRSAGQAVLVDYRTINSPYKVCEVPAGRTKAAQLSAVAGLVRTVVGTDGVRSRVTAVSVTLPAAKFGLRGEMP